MKNRFVAIEQNVSDEFAFCDVETGRRYHLDKNEYDSLRDIIFEHEREGFILEPVDAGLIADAILDRGRVVLGDKNMT